MKRLFFITLLFPCFCFGQESNLRLTQPTKYQMSLRLSDVSIGTNETQRRYYLAHLNRRTGYHLIGNTNFAAEPQLSRYGRKKSYNYEHILSPMGQGPEAIIFGLLQWSLDKAIQNKED